MKTLLSELPIEDHLPATLNRKPVRIVIDAE